MFGSHPSVDQGTADRLSQSWMPLKDCVEQIIAGLCRGDPQIAVGSAKGDWERFESAKVEEMSVDSH